MRIDIKYACLSSLTGFTFHIDEYPKILSFFDKVTFRQMSYICNSWTIFYFNKQVAISSQNNAQMTGHANFNKKSIVFLAATTFS